MDCLKKFLINFVAALKTEKTWVGIAVLAAAGVAPNIFPAAQAGMAKMSDLAIWLLVPSIVFLAACILYSTFRGFHQLTRRIWVGMAFGALATLGLEAVRYPGFLMEWMPGNLPQLMGVLITDSFMQGPTLRSDLLGFLYHFWNGACFGMIYTVLLGRKAWYWGAGYGIFIGLGFLASPVVKSLGIGFMGMDMPSMAVVAILAHLAYGVVLGFLTGRWLQSPNWLFQPDNASDTVL